MVNKEEKRKKLLLSLSDISSLCLSKSVFPEPKE